MYVIVSIGMKLEHMVGKYLDSKRYSWSASSMKSEGHRLNALVAFVDGKPETLMDALKEYAPYGRVTAWSRVSDFYEFCIEEGAIPGPNVYKMFRRKHAKVFKNVYERRPCEVSYEEARRRIQTIEDEAVRNKALQLLEGGLRYNESFTLKDNYVVGKGGKSRRAYVAEIAGPSIKASQYQTLRRALKRLGLRPHNLRSVFLSRLVEEGANAFELKKVAGWSSMATAESYINTNDAAIRTKVAKIVQHGGTDNEHEVPKSIPKRSAAE